MSGYGIVIPGWEPEGCCHGEVDDFGYVVHASNCPTLLEIDVILEDDDGEE